MVAVGLVGSFSGKARSRRTSEKRDSFSMRGQKMWVLLTARFVSISAWLPANSAPNRRLLTRSRRCGR